MPSRLLEQIYRYLVMYQLGSKFMEKPGAPIFNFFRRLFGFYRKPPPPTVPIAGGSTSQRDIIETTYSKDNPTLLRQIREAQKYRSFIEEAANQYGFLPAIVCPAWAPSRMSLAKRRLLWRSGTPHSVS